MVYEVCLHGYTRINKWFMQFVYMDMLNKWFTWIYTNKQMILRGLFTWIYTNKQMVYAVCLHGYAQINKWFMRFVYIICTNKQMVYEVYLHGYTRINKWFMQVCLHGYT